MDFLEVIKINRILRNMAIEKRQMALKDITTIELIDELTTRLKTGIYGLCELCSLENNHNRYFALDEHNIKICSEMLCKNHTNSLTQ